MIQTATAVARSLNDGTVGTTVAPSLAELDAEGPADLGELGGNLLGRVAHVREEFGVVAAKWPLIR